MRRVEPTWKSLSEGEIFILDAHSVLYQWTGKTASMRERGKALDFTTKTKQVRVCVRAHVCVLYVCVCMCVFVCVRVCVYVCV